MAVKSNFCFQINLLKSYIVNEGRENEGPDDLHQLSEYNLLHISITHLSYCRMSPPGTGRVKTDTHSEGEAAREGVTLWVLARLRRWGWKVLAIGVSCMLVLEPTGGRFGEATRRTSGREVGMPCPGAKPFR